MRTKGSKDKTPRKKRTDNAGIESYMKLEPGDMGKFVGNALELYNLPKINTADPIQVENRINEYFMICAKNDIKPSVVGLSLAIGVDRRTLWTWSQGSTREGTHMDLIKKAYQLLNLLEEDYMRNGKTNPVSAIFLLKNHFGYKDQQDVVIEPKNGEDDNINPDELKQKYLDSVVKSSDNVIDVTDIQQSKNNTEG